MPFSFLGLQLMHERRLIPNCYTIISAMTGAIVTSWRLEASNDLSKWVILDTRHGHLHSHEAFSAICRPGGATTWGVSSTQFHKGFSAFRIVQIDVNTARTHVMSLAGIELYGVPANPERWTF